MAEVLVELDDCRALEHLQESDFTVSCFLIFRVHVVQVYLFECVLFAVKDVTIQADAASGSLTQRPYLLILGKPSEFLQLRLGRGRRKRPMLHLGRERAALLHPDWLDQVVRCSQL